MNLQLSSLPASWRLLLWLLLLASPLVAWALAAAVVGAGNNSRFSRAAAALGRGAWVLAGTVLAVRLLAWLGDAPAGGPLRWFAALDDWWAGQPTGRTWLPLDAAFLSGCVLGLLLWVAAPLLTVGLGERKGPFRVQGRNAVAGLVAGLGLVGLYVLQGPYLSGTQPRLLVDVAGLLPLLCVSLVIWTRTEFVGAAAAVPQALPQAPAVRGVNVPELWRSAGALSPGVQPLAQVAGKAGSAPGHGWADWAWKASGALGAAPRSLEQLFSGWEAPDQAWLVGDLPEPTEQHLLVGALLVASLRDGLPCLVVTGDPRGLGAAYSAALDRAGQWAPGPLAVGAQGLREALASDRPPALTFLDLDELSSHAIRTLGQLEGSAARAWLRSLGLVVLPRVDRGSPLETTHRRFTLRRLDLVLTAAGSRCSVLATGVGGAGTRSLVDQSFLGLSAHLVPLAPEATAPVQAWPVDASFRTAVGEPWVKRALKSLPAAGVPAVISDPSGAFDAQAVKHWGTDTGFSRDISLAGEASVSALDEGWLVASLRAMGQRVPLPGGRVHHALWGMVPGPVQDFLSRPGTVQGLIRTDQVPAPAPLVGRSNHHVAASHLRAALTEASQDEEALQALFDRSTLENQVENNWGRSVLRIRRGVASRSRTVPLHAVSPSNPLRDTVSESPVEVQDENGVVLGRVDRELVQTRYYPNRVFAAGEARYEVPLHAWDEKRGLLRVRRVADRPVTRPRLHFRLEPLRQLEAPLDVELGALAFRVQTVLAKVTESVTGFSVPGRRETVRMEPVSSTYDSPVRLLFFAQGLEPRTLQHLARTLDAVLLAHLLARDEDVEVVALSAGELGAGSPAGLAVVDRHLGGMGVAEALDRATLASLFRWASSVTRCANPACVEGCAQCTPEDVEQPDAVGVRRLLAG
ncbi:MAG: hypothetical protein RL653_2820 [Pseudomonadota bacterium]